MHQYCAKGSPQTPWSLFGIYVLSFFFPLKATFLVYTKPVFCLLRHLSFRAENTFGVYFFPSENCWGREQMKSVSAREIPVNALVGIFVETLWTIQDGVVCKWGRTNLTGFYLDFSFQPCQGMPCAALYLWKHMISRDFDRIPPDFNRIPFNLVKIWLKTTWRSSADLILGNVSECIETSENVRVATSWPSNSHVQPCEFRRGNFAIQKFVVLKWFLVTQTVLQLRKFTCEGSAK